MDLSHFKERQARLVFYESKEFKEAELKRIERSKPREHEAILNTKNVYCPIEGRIRPAWLCEKDDHIELDNDPSSPSEAWA